MRVPGAVRYNGQGPGCGRSKQGTPQVEISMILDDEQKNNFH